MDLKKIVVAGGTGFLGQAIVDKFNKGATQLIVLTRGRDRQEKNVMYLHWDGKTMGKWSDALNDADVLINLTGKSINCRYNRKNKREIISSRVNATRVLGEAINKTIKPPKLWLNASAASIYPDSEYTSMDEFTVEEGTDFSADVCRQWEKSFNDAETPGTRKAVVRITMVLGRSGGVLPVMKKLVNTWLGGKMGSGKQFISWIHEEDFLNALIWLIEHDDASGPYNFASPEPITNAYFMTLMRKQLHKGIGLPATKWMLEIGAFFLQTETELILKSRKVTPAKLLKGGFIFNHPTIASAFESLL